MTGLVCAWCDQPSTGMALLPEPFLVGLDAETRWPSCGAEGHGVSFVSRGEQHRAMLAAHAEHAERQAAAGVLDLEPIRRHFDAYAAARYVHSTAQQSAEDVPTLLAEVERLRAIIHRADAEEDRIRDRSFMRVVGDIRAILAEGLR